MNVLAILQGIKMIKDLKLSKPNVGPLTTAGGIAGASTTLVIAALGYFDVEITVEIAAATVVVITAIVQAVLKKETS